MDNGGETNSKVGAARRNCGTGEREKKRDRGNAGKQQQSRVEVPHRWN